MRFNKFSFIVACMWAVASVWYAFIGEYVAASGLFVAAIAWWLLWSSELRYNKSMKGAAKMYNASIENIKREFKRYNEQREAELKNGGFNGGV